jgi:hypothetical protein
MDTKTSTSRERNKEKRDAEKKARKAANIAKVEATKREKDVWEKLQDEKKGISTSASSDTTMTKVKSTRVRKVHPKNLMSHHRNNQSRNWIYMSKGKEVVRVMKADVLTQIDNGYKPMSHKKAKAAKSV